MTTKFPFSKFGLKCDPRGAHVILNHAGRTLLGEVTNFRRDEVLGCTLLTVRHFNGEPWPIEPGCLAVDVLVREYEDAA